MTDGDVLRGTVYRRRCINGLRLSCVIHQFLDITFNKLSTNCIAISRFYCR